MSESQSPPAAGPRPGVMVAGRTFTGPIAIGITLVVLAGVIALTVWARPSIPMLIAAGIWLGFILYWSFTAGEAGEGRAEESRESRARRQGFTNLGLLLMFVSIPGLRWPFLPANAWHVPAGLAAMAVATLFHVWARFHLGRNWSSAVMIKRDHRLVKSGPYRFVRHPVYTAILALCFGTALVSARIMSLAGALLFAIVYVQKLRIEERALAATFGADWDDYRRRSWALLPFVY